VLSAPPSGRFLAALGLFAVAWTVVWVLMGVWTKHEVQTLRQLSNTVIQSGVAVRQTGQALQGLGSIPFVGGEMTRVGREVSVAGANAQRSGRSSRSAVGSLSTLLGVAIAVVPTVPMLVLFLVTWRLARVRRSIP
jgi:hypothetical protein